MEETKKCKCCGRELPISEFHKTGFDEHLQGVCHQKAVRRPFKKEERARL